VVQHLPSGHKAMALILSTAKKERKEAECLEQIS
jgi:hypothetical protein